MSKDEAFEICKELELYVLGDDAPEEKGASIEEKVHGITDPRARIATAGAINAFLDCPVYIPILLFFEMAWKNTMSMPDETIQEIMANARS